MNQPRTRDWFTAVQIAGVIILLLAIFAQSYNGRRDVVLNNRRACLRGMNDRHANMEAWWAAYLARADQARSTKNPTLKFQYQQSADAYYNAVRSMETRVDMAHSLVWPVGSRIHPLGQGRFDCVKANPSASPLQFFN